MTQTATVTFDGTGCRYDGPTDLVSTDVLHVRFTNESDALATFGVWTPFAVIWLPAEPGTTNEGYGRFPVGNHESWCGTSHPLNVPGPLFDVA